MEEKHTVTLTQIASRGSVVFETSFGLSFIADRFLSETAINRYRQPRQIARRERVITLMSPCCQHALVKTPSGYQCSGCKAEPAIPSEFVTREYPTFEGRDMDALEQLVYSSGIDSLEAVLLADSIAQLVESFWHLIETENRTREILKLPEFTGDISL
jgi:hypothetical protein